MVYDLCIFMSQDLSSSVRWWHLSACGAHLILLVVLAMLDQPKTFPETSTIRTPTRVPTRRTTSDSLASAYDVHSRGRLRVHSDMSHAMEWLSRGATRKTPAGVVEEMDGRRHRGDTGMLDLFGFGVRDFFVFVLVFALNAALQYTGGLSLDQIQNSEDMTLYKAQKPILLVQSFVFLLVQIWFTITTAANAKTDTLGSEIVTSSVLYAVFYASFGVLQTLKHTVVDFEQRYDADVGFIVLSVTSKLCLSYHAVSIQKQIEQSLSDAPDTLSNTVDQLRAAVTALYVVSAVAVGLYAVWPQMCKKDNRYDDL